MKKVLVILAVLAMTGISSAAMINNPETFESYASGTVLNGPEGNKDGTGGATWSGWGSGSGTGGWAGGASGNSIVGSGASAAVMSVSQGGDAWGYNLLFNHGNVLANLLTVPFTLEFDVLSINVPGVAKIEYYDAAGGAIGVDAWDPVDLSALGHFSFTGTVPAGTVYVTPVIGVTGVGGVGIFDNIQLGYVPEPTSLVLLGLGGLLIRKRR